MCGNAQINSVNRSICASSWQFQHESARNPDLPDVRFKLELTESILPESIEDTIATMGALKEIGVML